MTRCALLTVVGLVAFSVSLPAQQNIDAPSGLSLSPPEMFNNVDSLDLIRQLPMLMLLDGQHQLPISSNLVMMALAPVKLSSDGPLVSAADAQKPRAASASRPNGKNPSTDGKDSSAAVLDSPLRLVDYGGEAGIFYGHSSGKFGGDEFGTYVIGTVGTDKFQITAGASYDEFNGRTLRLRSFQPPK